jgi:hypothetical protein
MLLQSPLLLQRLPLPLQQPPLPPQFEEPLQSSYLLSSDRPGIVSVGVLLQQSHDKQQQRGAQNVHGRNFANAHTKKQIQSNTNTPTTIPIIYSTGKSLSLFLAVEFEGDVIFKYEEFKVLLEFALISTKLPFITVTEVLRRPTDVIVGHKETYFT